jgi:hypothetical protein
MHAFAKIFFTKLMGRGFTNVPKSNDTKKPNATQPTTSNEGGGSKQKLYDNKRQGQKKTRKEFSDKSLKMGLFYIKKGTPTAKALPDKSTLNDGVGVCMGFCSHEKKCNFLHQLYKNGKHYTNWKNIPDNNKVTLLKHMDSTGLIWLNVEMFEKHKITIAPEYAHLLGDATRPKQKVAQKSM